MDQMEIRQLVARQRDLFSERCDPAGQGAR